MLNRLALKTKIVASYTVVFGLLLLAFAAVTYDKFRRSSLAELDARLAILAERVAEDLSQDIEDHEPTDSEDIQGFIPDDLEDAFVSIFRSSGELHFEDSTSRKARIPLPAELSEEPIVESRELHDSKYRVYWQPVEIDGEYPFVVQAAASLERHQEKLNQLKWFYLNLILIALVICGIITYYLTRSSLRPITRMTETAGSIGAEGLHARLDVPEPRDEVRNLAVTLNDLLARIESAFETQRRFVSDASHELRTPLTVIRSELEFTARLVEDAKSLESIKLAIAETARLERLTNQLMALVKIDSGQLKLDLTTVRLDDILADCVKLLTPKAAAKNVNINLRIEEALETTADALQLRSAVTNLLENAIKFSPTSTSVAATLSRAKTGTHAAEISITDSGPGIPLDEQELIFNRFYRAKQNRGDSNGSGLGLAIANDIVKRHNGQILLDSGPNGSRFTIALPLTSVVT